MSRGLHIKKEKLLFDIFVILTFPPLFRYFLNLYIPTKTEQIPKIHKTLYYYTKTIITR